MLNRRQFFGASIAGTGAALGTPAWLARLGASGQSGQDGRALVVVQLRGGNDGLNTLVPFEDAAYRRARPALGLAPRELLPADELNRFHPSLERVARRFAEGEVALVQNVGYPGPNLSHFRSVDVWESACPEGPLPATGWIGNYHDRYLPGGTGPIAMLAIGRDAMPRSMLAKGDVACAVPDLESYRFQAPGRARAAEARARRRALAKLNRGGAGGALEEVTEAVAAAQLSIEQLQRLESVSNHVAYPRSKLAGDLALAARVLGSGMRARFLYVTQDGYDTHVDQARDQAELLRVLDAAIDAFLSDLAAMGQLERTLVMTVSEFGRRVEESGIGKDAGTDHGAASVSLLFGTALRGGVHGGQPDLENLDENGNLVHRADFRQLYATVIEDWMGGASSDVLGRPFEKLEVIA